MLANVLIIPRISPAAAAAHHHQNRRLAFKRC